MVIENQNSVYRKMANALIESLSASGLGNSGIIGATIGFFIALSKKHNFRDSNYIYICDDIYNLFLEIDIDVNIRLRDICSIKLENDTIWRIIDIIKSVDDKALVDLFEEVISLQFTSSFNGQYYQPKELTHLVNQIVNKADVRTIYNPFAGIASYQIDNKYVQYISQEIDKNTWIVGKIRLFLHGIHAEYFNEDSLMNWYGDINRFDAIVSTPPFGGALTNLQKSLLYQDMGVNYSDIGAAFIDKAIKSISAGGLVVSIVPMGFLFRQGRESSLRQFLVDNKYIEAVIALPNGTFKPYAGVSTAIIVLSKRENTVVKFVDAQSMYSQTKRTNILNVDKILSSFDSSDEKYVRIVTTAEIEANDYNIDPNRYFIEEEIIPEGYKKIKLSEVSSIISGSRSTPSTRRVVNIGDLSSNSLDCIKKVEDIAEGDIKPNQFKLIEEPVLLLSMVRVLKPTYIEASPSKPIYVSQNILALRVDPSIINIPYLAFELARKSDSLQRGAVIPRFYRNEILNIDILIPDLATQEEILSKEKSEIEKAQYANKEAMIREFGLSAVIDAQKQELFKLISHRKHRINPYFSGMQDNLILLRNELIEVGSVSLSHKISPNYTVAELLDNFEKQIAHVKELFKNLTSEFVIGEKSTFNFVEFINSYRYVGKTPNLYLDVAIRSDGSIEDNDRDIFSSASSIKELIDIVIENAERHAFWGRDRGNVEIGYGEDGEGVYIQILNDGTPLDNDFNEELSFSEGYTYGNTGNTGKGLFRAKQICLGIGADISWINDDESLFATGILISIKNV